MNLNQAIVVIETEEFSESAAFGFACRRQKYMQSDKRNLRNRVL
jgi:hypothetical protein